MENYARVLAVGGCLLTLEPGVDTSPDREHWQVGEGELKLGLSSATGSSGKLGMGSVHWRDRCLTTTKLMGLRTAVAEILLADLVTACRAAAWLTDSSGWPHGILLARQWRAVPNLHERV